MATATPWFCFKIIVASIKDPISTGNYNLKINTCCDTDLTICGSGEALESCLGLNPYERMDWLQVRHGLLSEPDGLHGLSDVEEHHLSVVLAPCYEVDVLVVALHRQHRARGREDVLGLERVLWIEKECRLLMFCQCK